MVQAGCCLQMFTLSLYHAQHLNALSFAFSASTFPNVPCAAFQKLQVPLCTVFAALPRRKLCNVQCSWRFRAVRCGHGPPFCEEQHAIGSLCVQMRGGALRLPHPPCLFKPGQLTADISCHHHAGQTHRFFRRLGAISVTCDLYDLSNPCIFRTNCVISSWRLKMEGCAPLNAPAFSKPRKLTSQTRTDV